MSDNPFDSTYDVVIPPPPPPAPPPPPLVVPYRRVEPSQPQQQPQPPPMTPRNKLTLEERAWFWLRRGAAIFIMLLGVAWLYFVPLRGLVTWGIGFGTVGAGFAMLMFAGPSDAEKRGYHF